ncbi:cytochrome P450 (plasmid) [Streptomyces sp. NBC_01591]|uniref:cytochrome P450 n=1 Tax=Streptomyces sp. NBC_01591 TaxID=2975888 RepID=UPI002DDB433B|nr:cytochrome P450 [Streptomyces sp. NBC_01591]WSD74777.1 cytochrome P450 [Streptomyces sp. NBC_01591]
MAEDATEPETFPYVRRCPFAPPEQYREFREQGGPVRVRTAPGNETWLVTRYDQVKAMLNDGGLSNDRAHPGYPSPIPIPPEFRSGGSLLGMDAPRHTAYRKLVAGEFTHRRAQAMRPRIQKVVDRAIDEMTAKGPVVDLHAELGIKVTMSVITGMLGISLNDQEYLHSRTRVMFGGGASAAERHVAVAELNAYFLEIVRRKHEHPEDDLISRLMAKWPKPVDYAEAANMTRLLLNGGHDSTASMISLGTLTLLRHPGQLDLLRKQPTVAPRAVEELLRFLNVTDLTTARVAVEGLEIGGVAVKPGEGVYPSTAAANRDGAVFERPDELDITRGTRDHLAFGHGRHLCLGADIARVELELTWTTLFRRLPALRLAVPFEELGYRQGGLVFGVRELPVTW